LFNLKIDIKITQAKNCKTIIGKLKPSIINRKGVNEENIKGESRSISIKQRHK